MTVRLAMSAADAMIGSDMKRPIIGITMDTRDEGNYYQLGFDYAKAVETAGGVPLGIAYKTDPSLIPQILDVLDGILFTGGDDFCSARFGRTWPPTAQGGGPERQDVGPA